MNILIAIKNRKLRGGVRTRQLTKYSPSNLAATKVAQLFEGTYITPTLSVHSSKISALKYFINFNFFNLET